MIHTNKKTWQSQILTTIIFALITVCFIWQIAPGAIYSSSNTIIAQCQFDTTQPLIERETYSDISASGQDKTDMHNEIFILARHTDHKEIIMLATESETTENIPVKTEPATEATIEEAVELPTEAVTETTTEAPATTKMPDPTKKYNGIKEGDIIIGESTHYCACSRCNGSSNGITSSGYVIENGVQSYTVGCNWLPLGSIIEVNGVRYTVRDRGGEWFNSVGHIDIFVPEGHQAAREKGRLRNIEIKIISLP